MRKVDAEHIEAITLGASVYGTDGGSDPDIGKLIAMDMLRRHGSVPMIDVDSLLPDDLVVPVALVGAPTLAIDKFPSTQQFIGALAALEKTLGRKASVLMCAEAGGLNATLAIAVASQVGLPLLDGDLVGRAWPELQMALCDDRGNTVVMETVTNQHTERFVRSLLGDMGGSACAALFPMTGAQAKLAANTGSLTKLREAGDTILAARRNKLGSGTSA